MFNFKLGRSVEVLKVINKLTTDQMKKYKLKNGLTIITAQRKTKSVVIEVSVKAGSINETKKNAGISHFLEHMFFEGTKKRPNATLITNEIEKLGGDINAATSYARTLFFVKVLNKHFDTGLEILSDIILNSKFEEKNIEKERKIIIEEIHMVHDDPRHYQWYFFNETLFKNHPAKNPIYGNIPTVKKISRKDILNYYKKYYIPNNMVITVVGDVKNKVKKIENAFKSLKKKVVPKYKTVKEPKQLKTTVKKEKRKISQSHMVFGYKTAPRKHKDSYTLDIIKAILARGQSGTLFHEIRTKRGLAYEIGAYHRTSLDFGLFSIYAGTNKKNINKILNLSLKEIEKLKKVSAKALKEAKTFIEGDFEINNDDNQNYADQLASWEQTTKAEDLKSYIKKIKKVTKNDIKNVVNKYFIKNYTMIVIEQN